MKKRESIADLRRLNEQLEKVAGEAMAGFREAEKSAKHWNEQFWKARESVVCRLDLAGRLFGALLAANPTGHPPTLANMAKLTFDALDALEAEAKRRTK